MTPAGAPATSRTAFSLGVAAAGRRCPWSRACVRPLGVRAGVRRRRSAVGAPLLFVASFAAEPWQFILAWTLGAASIGGGLYYNVTMPALGRLFPDRRATALSGLTLLGAFASPIFYPLTAALIESMGWRSTLRVLVALLVVIVLPAVFLVRASGGGSPRVRAPGGSFVTALRAPPVYRALVVVALAAFANSAVMLHQISIMEATGLSLAAASSYAGLKGFCQLPGRVTLSPSPSPLEPSSADGHLLSPRHHFRGSPAPRP